MHRLGFIIRTLFPVETRRPVASRPKRSATGLSHALALTCALVPLGVMVQAMALTA